MHECVVSRALTFIGGLDARGLICSSSSNCLSNGFSVNLPMPFSAFLFSAYKENMDAKAPGVKVMTITIASNLFILLHKLNRETIDASVLLIEAGILGNVFFASVIKVSLMLVKKLWPSLNR